MKLIIETTYVCDICGKRSLWIKGQWIAHIYAIKQDEYEFHLCSEECDEKLSNMTKAQRVALYYGVKYPDK